jgi:putative FmdB family regulatory protein
LAVLTFLLIAKIASTWGSFQGVYEKSWFDSNACTTKLKRRMLVPIYEFNCSKCELNTELQSNFKDEVKPPQCNKCGVEMRRVYSAPAAIFKGTGWGGK